MKNLSILITDDNSFIREGIKLSLKKGEWKTSIDEASNGLEAVEFVKENDYDIILMDMSMPIMDGKEAINKILALKPNNKILMVSMHSIKAEIELLKENGARGYLLKDDIGKDLIKVINRVLADELVFDLIYY